LLATGFLVSTFDFTALLFVGVQAFLLTRDFFSRAMMVSPVFVKCFTQYRNASGWPNSTPSFAVFQTAENNGSKAFLCRLGFLETSPQGLNFNPCGLNN
jgi:hypothetical protein